MRWIHKQWYGHHRCRGQLTTSNAPAFGFKENPCFMGLNDYAFAKKTRADFKQMHLFVQI